MIMHPMTIFFVNTSPIKSIDKKHPKTDSSDNIIEAWVSDVYFCATFCTKNAIVVLNIMRYNIPAIPLLSGTCIWGSNINALINVNIPADNNCTVVKCIGFISLLA